MNKLEHKLSILNITEWTNLISAVIIAEHCWTILNTSENSWTYSNIHEHPWTKLNTTEQFWTKLNKSEHTWDTAEYDWTNWTSLNTTEYIWTYLNSFQSDSFNSTDLYYFCLVADVCPVLPKTHILIIAVGSSSVLGLFFLLSSSPFCKLKWRSLQTKLGNFLTCVSFPQKR